MRPVHLPDTYLLSEQATSLWGKSDHGEGERWLPLFLHMYDSARVARGLWELWVPKGTKAAIARALHDDELLAETVFVFLAGVHDIGKATPAFQSQRISVRDEGEAFLDWKPREAGLDTSLRLGQQSRPTHAVAGQLVFERHFESRFDDDYVLGSYSSIIGNHHGKSPGEGVLRSVKEGCPQAIGADDPLWRHVQGELIEFVRIVSGLDEDVLDRLEDCLVPAPIASLLVGLVIMADWIASNTDFFPLLLLLPETPEGRALQQGTISFEQLGGRFDDGWSALGLLGPWGEPEVPDLADSALFAARFGFSPGMAPRPVQLEAAEIVEDSPDLGLMVIEAPSSWTSAMPTTRTCRSTMPGLPTKCQLQLRQVAFDHRASGAVREGGGALGEGGEDVLRGKGPGFRSALVAYRHVAVEAHGKAFGVLCTTLFPLQLETRPSHLQLGRTFLECLAPTRGVKRSISAALSMRRCRAGSKASTRAMHSGAFSPRLRL